jgi:hypothetical protein
VRYLFKILGIVLLVSSLITAPAGAIYLEGQAPPDDTSPYILAASSGLTYGDGAGTVIPAEVANGNAVLLFHASFAYPAVEAVELPKVSDLYASIGSVPRNSIERLPWIASSRYWGMPGISSIGAT